MSEDDFERFTRIVLDEFKRVHQRFDTIDVQLGRFEYRITNIETELGEVWRPLDRLEAAAKNVSGFTKEIDHLLKRPEAIEKHLGLESSISA